MRRNMKMFWDEMQRPADQELNTLKKMIMMPGKLKQFLLLRLLCFSILVLIWIYINGGLVPFFLKRSILPEETGSGTRVLQYFTHADNDGLKIRWAHGVNTKQALERALESAEINMVEGDVMLKGQGTTIKALIPVMAHPPATDGEMTLEEWLNRVLLTPRKGFKLDFQTMDSVEVSLQMLHDMKDKIKVPVWLHADVHQGPHGGPPNVEAIRFIRTIQRLFPDCTISLGWTSGFHTDLSQSGYTWEMMFDMYYFVNKYSLERKVVFSVRSAFISNSVPQLKWLIDNTGGSILVWHSPENIPHVGDLMYIAYKFPPPQTFFDLNHDEMDAFLQEHRHNSRPKLDPLVLQRETVVFRPEAWLKMGFHIQIHSILPSTEALVLTNKVVYVVSKTKYQPSDKVKLMGRIQFLNPKKIEAERGVTGLSIYVRPTEYTDYEHIVGIRCFLGIDGQIEVGPSHMDNVPDFKRSQNITPGSMNCYRFTVQNTDKEIIFTVNVQHECNTLRSSQPDPQLHARLTVPLPQGIPDGEFPFIIKLEDSKRTAVFDELTIKYIS
ncbi:hypothetical protein ACJMK2_042184 [Sinanodonta woodiana]|uniref:Menorin-like domain-containing protein n=1 Tax=Sinanodonta woodiana TaxID=1069815 RepID=A0ABD3W9K6_SINWO